MITQKMKEIIRKILGDQNLGIIDFYRYPEWKKSWGGAFEGAFNGQDFRCKIFSELVEQFNFSAIFETGTFHGSTTSYMSNNSRLPIYTVEGHERTFGYCRARFWNNKLVNLSFGDSRLFLMSLLKDTKFQNVPIFFYLDAHWDQNLPLLEECQIILDHKIHAVIMIDDFEVVGDKGYKFDDYGDGKQLTLEYLQPIVNSVSMFFPNCKSDQETGAKKGCIVLGTSENVTKTLENTKTLVRFI